MSSHREAPAISKDPVADNTDLYAFVDPADTSKVTVLANFIPLEEPAGGPNFFQFGDEVLYEILIDNDGDGEEDVVYQFRFKTIVQNPGTFLYNTGPISSLTDPNWNVRQSYTVTRIRGERDEGRRKVLGSDLPTPPVRIGPRSTPDYVSLANAAVQDLGDGVKTFAGQRGEGFYVDLGSIFDLGALRQFQNLHLIPTPAAPALLPNYSVSDLLHESAGPHRLGLHPRRSVRDPPARQPAGHHPVFPEYQRPAPRRRIEAEPRLRAELRCHGLRDQPARGQ